MRPRSIQSIPLGNTRVLKRGQNKHGRALEQVFGISAAQREEERI